MGEYGGHGLAVSGHLWREGTTTRSAGDATEGNWGYGVMPKHAGQLRDLYTRSLAELGRLKAVGIAASIYTQTSDVEGEINGLLTYDRRVAKLDPAGLKPLHDAIVESGLEL